MFSETSAAAVTCGIMKPEFRPGFGVRNAGRPDSAGSTSMAMRRSDERADLADGQRDHVGGKSHRLGVEIAARKRRVVLGEDQRIVGDAVGLGLQRVGRLAQHVERRAHHLRLAAQAVGVLHAVVADPVRGADGAAGHQRAQRVGRLDLAAMPAQRMDARVERRVGTRAASVDSAPVTSAAWNSTSASNSAASA